MKHFRAAQPIFGFVLALLLSVAVFSTAIYYSCSGRTSVSLTLDVQSESKYSSTGQVFWDVGIGFMQEKNSQVFDIRPGRHRYQLSIPLESRSLRIDPLMEPGSVAFHQIKITACGWTLQSWDSSNSFAGWKPVNELTEFGVSQGALRMRSTGDDPYFQLQGLPDLRQARQSVSLWASLILGPLAALIQAGLFGWIALYRRPAATAAAPVGQPIPPSRRQHAVIEVRALGLFLISSVISVSLGYLAYEKLIRPRALLEAPIHNIDYELTFVDQQGQPLSEVPGDLKMVLDPYTLYRNFPGQKTSRFTVNEYGYRQSSAAPAATPAAVMLGGSAVFGVGLASDSDTLTSRLNSLGMGYRFINAGAVGFLSGQELAEMIHYADRQRPALYVVLDGWNEEYMQLFTNLHSTEFGFNWSILDELEGRLRSLLEKTAPKMVRKTTAGAVPQLDAAARQSRIYETYITNLKKMSDFAQVRGARFLVAFQPQLGNKTSRTPSEQKAWKVWREAYPVTHAEFVEQYNVLIEKARAYCQSQQIPYLDLNASPRLREPSEEIFLDTVHLNANANRMVAEMLTARISEMQSVKP